MSNRASYWWTHNYLFTIKPKQCFSGQCGAFVLVGVWCYYDCSHPVLLDESVILKKKRNPMFKAPNLCTRRSHTNKCTPPTSHDLMGNLHKKLLHCFFKISSLHDSYHIIPDSSMIISQKRTHTNHNQNYLKLAQTSSENLATSMENR